MNFRIYSRFLVIWVFVDMFLKYHYETSITHIVRIVVPLALTAGTIYFAVRKRQEQENTEWRHIIMFLVIFPLISLMVFFHWY